MRRVPLPLWLLTSAALCACGGVEPPGPLDADGDGVVAAADCDDDDPEAGAPLRVYLDHDGDGFGADDIASDTCAPLDGWIAKAGDCDDTDPEVHPDASEVCNGRDDNCDGAVDAADPMLADAPVEVWVDADGDGWGTGEPQERCPGEGWTDAGPGDCDDGDATVSPSADEVCGNGRDDDCSGDADECSPAGAMLASDASAIWIGPTGGRAGSRLAPAGDVDGDGLDDVLVASVEDGTGGSVALVLGDDALGDHDLAEAPTWRSETALARLGSGGSAAGDADGDGYADIVLGADGADRVYLLRGGPDLAFGAVEDAAALTLTGSVGARVGSGAHWVGDVDGDGADDLLVNASFGGDLAGGAWLLSGAFLPEGERDLDSVAQARFTGQAAFDHFGGHPAAAAGGDFDGDGLSDLAFGAPGQDLGGADAGQIAVFSGAYASHGDFSPEDADLRVLGPGWSGDAHFGAALSAYDLDGDGVLDLFVGAPTADGDEPDAGAAFGFQGGAEAFHRDHTTEEATWAALGEATADEFGAAITVAALGEGEAGLFVGAPGRASDGRGAGGAYLFGTGSETATWRATDALLTVYGPGADAQLGAALSAVSVDGGPTDALLVGAPGTDSLSLIRIGGL